MKKIDYYHDVCTVNIYTTNVYGVQELEATSEVPCLFNWSFGQNHSNWVDFENVSATAYLDIDNLFIQEWKYRLEGAYLVFNRHNDEVWYRINHVTLGITLLTDNVENNCFVTLTKAQPIILESE